MFFIISDEFWRINEPFHNLMGTGNLVIQLLVLVMIMMSVHYKRKGDLIGHGNMMVIAFITNFISFVLVMLTGFIYFYVSEPLSLSYKLSLIHGLIGGSAMLSGLWLLLPWLIHNSSPRYCAGKRIPMRVTFSLWVFALLLGIGVWFLDVVMGV